MNSWKKTFKMLKTQKHMKYIKAILSIVCLVTLCKLNAQVIDQVIAVVEDEIILLSDIEIQKNQFASEEIPESQLSCSIFEQLLVEKVFVVEAQRDSIYVSDEEVDNELDRRISYFEGIFGSVEKLEAYYGKTIDQLKKDFKRDIQSQLLSDRMRANIFADLIITPAEVTDFFNSIPNDSLPYFNAEVELGEIVILATPSILQKEQAKNKAISVRQEILDGSDFSFQALLYSCDPGSASKGGDLGYVSRGQLVTEFEAAAFRLKNPGDISEVVESKFGFHIIQLIDKKGERINVKHVLICPETTSEDLENAYYNLEKIKKKLIDGEISFEDAVKKHSMEELSKNAGGLVTNPQSGNTFFEMDEVSGYIAVNMNEMEVGDYSEILPYETQDGKNGVRIIYLKSETKPHQASLETDYSKIKGVAKQAKEQVELNEWLNTKSKSVYMKIQNEYATCPNLNLWLN